ncbi:MAG TPA: PAS domain S-box protein, partial [Gammaproteobacteria bacterium]|nr:PAS domain S-box protein [Gammaproteobacteria bacterium]
MESPRSEQDRQVERVFFASEAEFRTLVDASPAIIWFINTAGHCRYINRSYLEFFGKTEEEITGEGWHQLIHPDEAAAYIATVRQAVRERTSLCSRSRMCRHDKQWRWIESHGRPHYGTSGRYLGLVGHNFDITDNVEGTRILRESEERLRIATEAGQIYTWEVDEASRAIHHSPNAARILGFDPPQDYAGKAGLLHPGDRAAMVAAAERAVREGTDFSQEYRVINPHTGEILWVRSQGIHKGEPGKSRRFIGVAQNITARKRAELNATFLARIGDDFSRLCSATEIMRVVGEKVYRYLGLSRLTFVNINKTVDEVTGAYEVHEPGVIDCKLAYKLQGLISENCCQQLQAGHTVAIDDIETDPRTAHNAEAYRPFEVRSQLLAPYLSNGRWKFLLCAQHRQPYRWRADEMELMRELTERIYIRLERAYAEAALRQSEEEFRAIFEFSSVGKAQADPATGRLIRVNPKLCELTLYSADELLGMQIHD